ncbi:23544_t:CDS:1 [Cetraspora pellucida]|uniref:23544_t:CDS:1 n=1 Tax=Cetraspora pellucida TaxID=1433469 RepID=A0A9N9BG98_9GLOM|nr:23544_t:CDS:1 [Cetraspora pellucida]
MSSVYEKLLDTSHNPPSTYHQRQRLGLESKPKKEERIKKQREEEELPNHFEESGHEPTFTREDPDLTHFGENFKTQSGQIKRESRNEKDSELGKLGIDTINMADTLNDGECTKESTKRGLGVPQEHHVVCTEPS